MPFDAAPEVPAVTAEPKTEIGKALLAGLAALGPNGEYWCKSMLTDFNGRVCALGALGVGFGASRQWLRKFPIPVQLGSDYGRFVKASEYLDRAVPWAAGYRYSCVGYNDCHDTTFSDVRAMFLKAIALAEAEG